jgi:glycosyltransferase involved in cell wall biosynthesis
MSTEAPYISVIMPVYNGEKYIREALDSVLAQTFGDWELIIVDDASTDSTPEIIESYKKRDKRIRSTRNAVNLNCGPSANRGISRARGTWMARLDSDDVYEPDCLKEMARVTRELCGMDHFVSCWVSIVDAQGRQVMDVRLPEAEKIERMMPIENFLYHGATQFPKALWSKVGGYPEVQVESDDLALWKKFIKAGAKLHTVPEFLMRYRIHDSNMTMVNPAGRAPDPQHRKAFVKNAEWRISLFMKQGRLDEARAEIEELFKAGGFSPKRASYYLFTYLPPPFVYWLMWEARPRLRLAARRAIDRRRHGLSATTTAETAAKSPAILLSGPK